jgi:stearoyl-CoA desaturase (Delta-9 desaturase)
MTKEERVSGSMTLSQGMSQGGDVTARTRKWVGRCVTSLIVIGPLVAILLVFIGLWGRRVGIADLALLVGLYVLSCLGITAGYHRLFTHRSFVASRALKISLAVAGALAVEGSLMSWVSNHRRHHRHSDQTGDPHSPLSVGDHDHESGDASRGASLRGLFHAHVGWLFRSQPAEEQRFAPDLLEDRDLRVVSRLFPLWALFGLAIPFFAGWAFAGTVTGALTALVWGGLVRIFLVHHVTWSVNSVCHAFGRRPFLTRDRSKNFAPLALLSLGESWHNSHHAFPTLARHGVDRGQLDITAACIRIWERLGWVHDVRWPQPSQLARRRATVGA